MSTTVISTSSPIMIVSSRCLESTSIQHSLLPWMSLVRRVPATTPVFFLLAYGFAAEQ
jgi:hypothetical protein